jgi:hypothetical protein
MKKFQKAITHISLTGTGNLFFNTTKNRLNGGLILTDHDKTQLGPLPEIMQPRFRTGNGKAHPAPSQNFPDNSAFLLEILGRMKNQFKPENTNDHDNIRSIKPVVSGKWSVSRKNMFFTHFNQKPETKNPKQI